MKNRTRHLIRGNWKTAVSATVIFLSLVWFVRQHSFRSKTPPLSEPVLKVQSGGLSDKQSPEPQPKVPFEKLLTKEESEEAGRKMAEHIISIREHIDPELGPFQEVRNYVVPSKETLPKMIAVYSDTKLLEQAESVLLDNKATGLEATVKRINWLDYLVASFDFAQNPAHETAKNIVEKILLDSAYLNQKEDYDAKAMAADRIELFKEVMRTNPDWGKSILQKIPEGSTHRKVLENHPAYIAAVGVYRSVPGKVGTKKPQ